MSRLPAALVVRFAAALLPAAQREWGRAMVAEAGAIARPIPALRFAFGCLWAAASLRLRPVSVGQEFMMLPFLTLNHPRRVGAACAAGAIGLGFAYMTAAGAPASYLAMNAAALVIGLLTLAVLTEAARLARFPAGLVALSLSGLLLLVSLSGVSADGVTRWVVVGGVPLQPSLMLVPALALSFARSRDGGSALAIMVAALALALQPDRAMAGALAAAMAALALARSDRRVLAALAAALSAFAVTMLRPDLSPAMPFVDQIFFSSFSTHPLAGLAVVTGAALMLFPTLAGLNRHPDHRPAYAVFGALWLAVIAAAALGNYPTPLVGYGGSAILGYLISLIGLPPQTGAARMSRQRDADSEPADEPGALRTRLA